MSQKALFGPFEDMKVVYFGKNSYFQADLYPKQGPINDFCQKTLNLINIFIAHVSDKKSKGLKQYLGPEGDINMGHSNYNF